MRSGNALIDSTDILQRLGISPGAHVADFGCGQTGHFVLPAAQMVGEDGRVYAVDLQKKYLDMLTQRCAMHGICNVDSLWGDYEKVGGVHIPDSSLDTVFFVNNLGFLKRSTSFANELRRVLKDDGRLVVIDWKPSYPHPVAPQERFSDHDAAVFFAKLGFDVEGGLPVSSSHWGLVLKPIVRRST